jgi:hypothetical protein
MILLEFSVLSLQRGITLLKLGMFGLQTLELLEKFGKSSLCSISGLGGIESLTFQINRVLTENKEILLLLSHVFLELGVLFFGFSQPLLQVFHSLIGGQDLLEVAVYERRSKEALQLEKHIALEKK